MKRREFLATGAAAVATPFIPAKLVSTEVAFDLGALDETIVYWMKWSVSNSGGTVIQETEIRVGDKHGPLVLWEAGPYSDPNESMEYKDDTP